MSAYTPFKLLEINVISAQDLPPVSRMLRTYVVAWIQPDHKLTTRVDHRGHTNPTWNYKLVFRVDGKFLSSKASALMIEIYNVAWLRDTPIGSTHVPISNLLPPPNQSLKRSNTRSNALHIGLPSGRQQGILNINVHLIDDNVESMPLYRELSADSTMENHDLVHNNKENHDIVHNNKQHQQEKERQQMSPKPKLQRSKSKGTTGDEDFHWFRVSPVSKPNLMVSNPSLCSGMRPLPSEVAAGLKNELYSTAGDDFRSVIFDDWTVAGDQSERGAKSKVILDDWIMETNKSENETMSKIVRWQGEDTLPVATDYQTCRSICQRRHSEGGLFSCFSNLFGYQFSMICGGSNKTKNNRRKKKRAAKSNVVHVSHPEENLRMLHI